MDMQLVQLGSVAEFTNGGAWKQTEYVNSGIPVVRVTDCKDGSVNLSACKYLPESCFEKYRKNELQAGDLVIATVGSHPSQPGSVVGRPIVIPRIASGALLNQNAVCIRPIDNRLNKQYLTYLGKSKFFRDYIVSHARGSANQVRMAIGLLKRMDVPLPNPREQASITTILSAYDDLIGNNLRRIKILEEMAQNLYREWFIKFRFPGHEQMRMVKSALGRIPEGWEVTGALDSPHFSFIRTNIRPYEGEKRYYATADIDGLTISGSGIEYSWDEKPSRAQKQPTLNSVWFARMQETYKVLPVTRGNAAIAERCMLSSGFAGFKVSDEMNFPYLFMWVNSKEFHAEKDRYCTGATQRSLTNDGLSRILTTAPPGALVQQFGELMQPSIGLLISLQHRNKVLRKTCDFLLPKLISGELNVSEMGIENSQKVA